ncbi:nuclear transport factor 2 family protein [Nocardioides sp. BGMRC 2183]|nr:nuclear transport factor 2 family protein [Nocardioides sp. BGMRC 2183]
MQLTDADLIRNLLNRYCRLVDTGDFAGVGALMSRATLRSMDGVELAAGEEAVARMYATIVRLHEDGTSRTQHVVVNTVFDEAYADVHADGALATSTYLVLQATGDLPLQPIATGGYVDTFARDSDGWYFTERRFAMTLTGRLDQHLLHDPR